MATNAVEYVLSLKDQLTPKIDNANAHVKTFESTMVGTQSKINGLMGAAVGFMGTFAVASFIKSGVEKFNEMEDAIGQVKAGLESTKGVAGITFEELAKQAGDFSKKSLFSRNEIMDMQTQLLSFHSITKPIYQDTQQAIMDIAAKTHHTLFDVSIAVGKAFADPERGIGALRRYGVAFTNQEDEVIKDLVARGKLLEAQKLMVKAIQTDYAGSAEAFTKTSAGQMVMLRKQIGAAKVEIGQMVMELVIAYKPQIESLIKSFKSFIDWIKDNKDTIIALGSGIVKITVATYAFGRAVAAVKTVIGAYKTLEGTLIAVKAAQVALNSGASLSTVIGAASKSGVAAAEGVAGAGAVGTASVAGMVIAFLPEILAAATVVAAVGVLYSKLHVTDERKEEFDKEQAESNMILMQIAKNTEPKPANVMGMNFTSAGGSEVSKTIGAISGGYMKLTSSAETVKDKFDALHKTAKGYTNGISDAISGTLMAQDDILAGKEKNTKKEAVNKALSDAQNNVTGQQIKNYNITIRELVHEFNVRTETLKDSKNDIKMLVAAALTDAVNDAQISH
jgi:hypothetical protein